jgi:endonuclease YncB( thermonuclease family)
VRLANGQRLRVDGFWIEDGEIRFRRLGGMIGMALAEVVRLVPESIAPVHGRTPVRFARKLAPDLIEVRVQSGLQRVRLIGVEPVPDASSDEAPWSRLALGLVVYLEFDRQRYAPGGDWLAYVFLPSGRMLNAELIRLGLAKPRADARNLRYLDLFQELADPAG